VDASSGDGSSREPLSSEEIKNKEDEIHRLSLWQYILDHKDSQTVDRTISVSEKKSNKDKILHIQKRHVKTLENDFYYV
jgi:hypothetical protein